VFWALDLLDVAAACPGDPVARADALRARLAGVDAETTARIATALADVAVT
jgi:hypothetical protein